MKKRSPHAILPVLSDSPQQPGSPSLMRSAENQPQRHHAEQLMHPVFRRVLRAVVVSFPPADKGTPRKPLVVEAHNKLASLSLLSEHDNHREKIARSFLNIGILPKYGKI
jgi:hypothetical protein